MTRNKSGQYREKGLSVFLTVLMVLSVVAMSAAFAGSAAASSNPTNADVVVNWDDIAEEDRYQGQSFNISNLDEDTDIDVDDPSFVQIVEGISGDPGDTIAEERVDTDTNSVEFDRSVTSELEGFYHLNLINESAENERSSTFEIFVAEVEFEFDDDEPEIPWDGENVTTDLDWTSDERTDTVDLELTGEVDGEALTPEEINATFEDTDAWEEEDDYVLVPNVDSEDVVGTANFTEAGEYEFTIRVQHTTGDASQDTATADVTVGEEPEPVEAEFLQDVFENNLGDNVTIQFEVSEYDDEELFWEIETDGWYGTLNLTVDDPDYPVNITFNSAEAGHGDSFQNWSDVGDFEPGDGADNASDWHHADFLGNVVTVENADDITANDTRNIPDWRDRLAEDEELSMSLTDTEEDEEIASAEVHLTERGVFEDTVRVHPLNAWDDADYQTAENLTGAFETSEIAMNDTVAIEYDIGGVHSYWDGGAADDVLNSYAGLAAYLELTEHLERDLADAPARFDPPEDDPDPFSVRLTDDLDWVNVTTLEDENKLYILIDQERLYEEFNDTTGVEMKQDHEFEVRFTEQGWDEMDDEDVQGSPFVSEDVNTTSTYELLQRTIDLDIVELPYSVTPDENATFTGTTTIAPGSLVELDLDGPEVEVLDELNTTVADDRTWVIQEDLTDEGDIDHSFDIEAEAPQLERVWPGMFADTAESELVTRQELMDQIDELEEENDELTILLAEIRGALGVDDNDEILDAIDELGDVDQEELDALQEQLDEANATIEDLEADNEQLRADNEELADALEAYQQALDDANATIEQLEADRDQLQSMLDDANETIADLEEQLDADVEELQAQLDEANLTIEGLESDLANASETIETLEGELEDANDRIDELETIRDGLQDAISDLEDDVSELEDERDSLQDENVQLQEDLNEVNQDLADTQADLDAWMDTAAEYGVDDLDALGQALAEWQAMDEDDTDDADDADDDDEQPAFGPIAALLAILAGGAIAARRRF